MSERSQEIELIKSSLEGQAACFEVLVTRYQSLVCAITYSATLNLDKSEELAQEAFLLAWKNLSKLRDLTKFKAWLCRITKSVVLNWLRARKRDVLAQATSLESVTTHTSTDVEPAAMAIQKEQEAVVTQALASIPEGYRVPLILFYRENKSTKQVGATIGLNENATRQRITRARRLLKDQVATMVETTLAQSKPGKAFATGVVAALTGMAIKGMTPVAAAGTVGVGATVGAMKIAATATGLLLVAGVSAWFYHDRDVSTPRPMIPSRTVDSNATDAIVAMDVTATMAPNQVDVLRDSQSPREPATYGYAENLATRIQPDKIPHVFQPRGILCGRITCAETGVPVRDATLRINGQGRRFIRTDEYGFYYMDRTFDPGSHQLFIDSNDYVGFGLNTHAPTLNVQPDQQIIQHFQLPRACKVAVRVVDVNGVALKGVDVIPTSVADSRQYQINQQMMNRRTDVHGFVQLGGFPPLSTDYMITAIASKTVKRRSMGQGLFLAESRFTHSPAHVQVRLADPNYTPDVTIVLKRGRSVHGYAEYSDGQPARGAELSVQPSWWHCMAGYDPFVVREDGTFSIPRIVAGTYDIHLHTRASDGMTGTSRSILQTMLDPNTTTPLVLELPVVAPQTQAAICGHLYFQGNEKPREVTVEARSKSGDYKHEWITLLGNRDKDEYPFSIGGLREGIYRLTFNGANIETKVVGDVTVPTTDLEVILVTSTSPSATGFVLDGETQEPVTGFHVRVRTVEGSRRSGAERWIRFSHQEGRFDHALSHHGRYQLQVWAKGYAPYWTETIDTRQGYDDLAISLTAGGTLQGRVVDAMGQPVDGAQVIPLSLAGDTRQKTRHQFVADTGAVHTKEGVFTLSHLPVGWEAIKIVHPEFSFQIRRHIPISAGQTTYLDDAVLTSGAIVEGYVWDEQGQPLANEAVYVRDPENNALVEPSRRWTTTQTDTNGFYRLDHLPAQECIVYRDHSWKSLGVKSRVVLPQDGQTLRLDFGGSFKVDGMLKNADGTGRRCRMRLFAWKKDHFECATRADDRGGFGFVGVVPGTYTIEYETADGRSRWQRLATVTVSDQDVDLGVINPQQVKKTQEKTRLPVPEVDPNPRPRFLSIKLPLDPARFHWTFHNQADFLAGKLLVRIKDADRTENIVVFEDGKLSKDWEPVDVPNPNAGEIYFGFQSSLQYVTSPNDTLEIELTVVHDLDGIGALHSGVLPVGMYRSTGTYSSVVDTFPVSDIFRNLPPEALAKIKANVEFRATAERWDPHWPLHVTNEQGWLQGKQREMALDLLEQLLKQEQKASSGSVGASP